MSSGGRAGRSPGRDGGRVVATVDPRVAAAVRRHRRGADPRRAVLLGEGWNATASRVPAPAGDLVVRVPRLAWAAGEMERHACLMPRLRALGLPVVANAAVLGDGRGGVIAGVHRYLGGTPARPHGRDARERLAREVRGFLTRLHAVPLADYRAYGAVELGAWPGRFGAVAERTRALLPARSRAWVDGTVARLRRTLSDAPPAVPLHDDLQPAHLLLDARGALGGVLDWSGPQIGDPAIDFRRLVQFFGAPFAERALAHYGGRVDAHFRERMRVDAALGALITLEAGIERGLPRWEAYARRQVAALAAAATRTGAGA